MKGVKQVWIIINGHLRQVIVAVIARWPDNDGVIVVFFADGVDGLLLDSAPDSIGNAMRLIQYFVVNQIGAIFDLSAICGQIRVRISPTSGLVFVDGSKLWLSISR